MKNLILLLFFISTTAFTQVPNPVLWTATYKAINANEGEIIIQAAIEKGWHTYSQRPTEAGPIPTSFIFKSMPNYQLNDKTIETDAHEEFVKAFDAKIFVFTTKAEFKQKIKLKVKSGFTIPLKIEYMCCNDMMCLPPKTIELLVKIQ
jgi:thiol:disulfide interchange protein DsbD